MLRVIGILGDCRETAIFGFLADGSYIDAVCIGKKGGPAKRVGYLGWVEIACTVIGVARRLRCPVGVNFDGR